MKSIRYLGLSIAAALFNAPASEAAVFITLNEVIATGGGTDVVMSASGTLDLSGLTVASTATEGGYVFPSVGNLRVGPTSARTAYVATVSGFSDFGPGVVTFATSSSGPEYVGVSGPGDPVGPNVVINDSYVSGAPIAATSTFAGESLASLGANPGTYVWDLPNSDSVTLTIGAPVPEPSVAALLGLGGVCLLRRKRRTTAVSSS